jgi:hypothetical protein
MSARLNILRDDLSALERGALAAALARLLDPARHFSICDFDKMCHVAGVTLSKRERDALALLHCIDWRAMTDETRREATRLILETFGGDVGAWEAVVEQPAPKKTWLKRLGGGPS